MLDWTEETYAATERALGHAFRDRSLLLAAFTHTTYADKFGCTHNERLEFLGDAVLELCVTEYIYLDAGADEKTLTERRKSYVSQEALTEAEKRAHLMQYLRYLGGEGNIGGKTPSNLFEAAIGALYLDGGTEPVKHFLKRYLEPTQAGNYKTELQEYTQAYGETPRYEAQGVQGDFKSTVRALGRSAEGCGASKKEAENRAAHALLDILTKRDER